MSLRITVHRQGDEMWNKKRLLQTLYQTEHTQPASSEIPHFYQMPVTEREILAEHMGALAFEKVYGGWVPPPTFFLAVSLFHTSFPLLIEVVRGIVQQLTKCMTIRASF